MSRLRGTPHLDYPPDSRHPRAAMWFTSHRGRLHGSNLTAQVSSSSVNAERDPDTWRTDMNDLTSEALDEHLEVDRRVWRGPRCRLGRAAGLVGHRHPRGVGWRAPRLGVGGGG